MLFQSVLLPVPVLWVAGAAVSAGQTFVLAGWSAGNFSGSRNGGSLQSGAAGYAAQSGG